MPVIDDIEALKNAERALRESEIRMRALLDASQDEILLVSTDGTVLAINKAARARLAKRIAGSDPIGARLDQLLPKDLAESRLTVVQQVAATATLAHLEQQIGARWFECWFYPVVRLDGGVSEVAVYAREITKRKQAEANLRNLYQAIQQSPVSVIITDLKGRIEFVNPKFTEIFLIEALDAWSERKDGPDVLHHDVELRALSGASAGAMTAAIDQRATIRSRPTPRT